ncbi:shikimate dehydrogenase family protein [Tropicimonas isoalkanivorans]|uniref:Shikimate dehydrogenase n=1 Tax=Tropicimonas isoalkanivorans TaxID=441112 RepID=A0A1I1HAZ5_9RHOB|nr:shikimate dehydrogenase [Tropicimonas isoalkanivorans]SFC20936.1 shikimate dehydrogenase [Tropicimonas isoalkanivorans]
MTKIRLGLIGDNIKASRAPALHRYCGEMTGLDVSYDLFIPKDMGLTFNEVFEHVRDAGLTGVNVTLPYKERVVAKVTVDDRDIARIGSVNTVKFPAEGPKGNNTDFTGFMSAWRHTFGTAEPGSVVMFGAGGVGKAIAFALKRLGAREIVFIEPDTTKARALIDNLNTGAGESVARAGTLADLSAADGVVNATPLGMVGYGGTPVPEGTFPTARWAFDAVYTPVDTPFKAQAEAAGAAFLSGYELYYFQGVDAFEIFTGVPVSDHDALRRRLAADTAPA